MTSSPGDTLTVYECPKCPEGESRTLGNPSSGWRCLIHSEDREDGGTPMVPVKYVRASEVVSSGRYTNEDVERTAQLFHDTYEQLAPEYGWETQAASRVTWTDLPESNRALMLAVVGRVLESVSREVRPRMD